MTKPINDPLHHRLDRAVPKPGPEYWKQIASSLDDIEKGKETTRPVRQLASVDQKPSTRRSRVVFLAAAAAVVVALGTISLNLSNDSTTVTDIANPVEDRPADGSPGTTDSATPDSSLVDQTTSGEDPPITGSKASPIPPGTQCFVGTAPDDLLVVVYPADDFARFDAATARPGTPSSYTVAKGSVQSEDGTSAVIETTGNGAVSPSIWVIGDTSLRRDGTAESESADCETVVPQIVAAKDAMGESAPESSDIDDSPKPFLTDAIYCFYPALPATTIDPDIDLEVFPDGTVQVEKSPSAATTDATISGTGFFLTEGEMFLSVTRNPSNDEQPSSFEIWQVSPAGELTVGPTEAVFLADACG